jgi:hypothetical protein
MSWIPLSRPAKSVSGQASKKEQLLQRIQRDLSGPWFGERNETYMIHIVSTKDTWDCVRKNTNGEITSFPVRWNGGDSIIWGSSYRLKLSDLENNPHNPTWTSDFGKRAFVWERFHIAVALGVKAPSLSAVLHRVLPAMTPPVAEKKGVAAEAKFAKLSRGESSSVATVACPTASRKPPLSVVARTLNETGAEAAAAAVKMLRRLQSQKAVPLEFEGEVDQFVAKHSETRGPTTPAAGLLSSSSSKVAAPRSAALLELLSRRPPPPRMSPAEAELIEVVYLPLCVGCRVQAFFDNDWHFATVRQILNDGRFEVLWESEMSCSVLIPTELRRLR